MADVFKPTFRCRDPMSVSPRWIVADVLLMAALKRGHPIVHSSEIRQFFAETLETFFVLSRLTFWDAGFHVNTPTRTQSRFSQLHSKRAQRTHHILAHMNSLISDEIKRESA